MKTQLLIPAAGSGSRLGCAGPKALEPLAGKPLLLHTLARFHALGLAQGAVIVVPPGQEHPFREALAAAFPGHGPLVVPGGSERQHSVLNGLAALDSDTALVVIHDAARPFVAESSIRASIVAAAACGAATVAIPCVDTILEADPQDRLRHTPDRKALWACQTPQTFRVEVIRRAHEAAAAGGHEATDDATLVQRAGGEVRLVMGTPLNFKITTPSDLAWAEAVLEKGMA